MRTTSEPHKTPIGTVRHRRTMRVAAAVRAQAQSNGNRKQDQGSFPDLPVVVQPRRETGRPPRPQTRSFCPFLTQLIVQADQTVSLARDNRRRPAAALNAYQSAAGLKPSLSPVPAGSVLALTDV